MASVAKTAVAVVVFIGLSLAGPARAETVRFATYNAELVRKGPGVLLADILTGQTQVRAVADVIAATAPDVLLLTGFDWDHDKRAATAFQTLLAERGMDLPHIFSPRVNAGLPSDEDLDGNGWYGEARDSQGFGTFTGQGGMVVFSKYPWTGAWDYSDLLWRDLPGNIAPVVEGAPFPSKEAAAVQRLSSVAHWRLPLDIAGREVDLMVWHGSTPVFDGPEDLNGRRGADEATFWLKLLDGVLPFDAPEAPVVLMGDANIDPVDGDGRHEAIQALLTDGRLQDPRPTSAGGIEAANAHHTGDPATDTADFADPTPGNLRVDYVLPDARLTIEGAGVHWPPSMDPAHEVVTEASRHRLVWVDVAIP